MFNEEQKHILPKNEEQYIIHLDWDGPYKLNELSKVTDYETDFGIYQIYGAHPIYGANVLLYIGKADRQTFGVRIAQEGWNSNSDAGRLIVYVGRLAGNFTPANDGWSNEICLAEKLLIHAHKPAYNSQSIKSIPHKDLENIHILNWANHCSLMHEVSGARWTSKYDDMPDYKVYGEHE